MDWGYAEKGEAAWREDKREEVDVETHVRQRDRRGRDKRESAPLP